MYPVIDLFCGIGGLSYGFVQEQFKVICGIDIDEESRFPYEENIKSKFLCEDLTQLPSSFIGDLFPENQPRVLIGCAPCQAFSTYSQKYKDNDKWKLLYSFGRLIKDIQPEIISMENVPNLKNYKSGKVFEDFLKILRSNDYSINWQIVNASDYGVPQNRRRLILLASKLGEINLLAPTHTHKKVTVRQAIAALPPLKDGEANPYDVLHKARKLSPLNRKRIKATPMGGSWKDWPEDLRLECHKKDSGQTFTSVYGRMNWDSVSPTMTTQCTGLGNGRFGHPEQDRAITLREAAILQSFPNNYKFTDPKSPLSLRSIERHIGNAVPVLLGRVIAKSIKQHLIFYGY